MNNLDNFCPYILHMGGSLVHLQKLRNLVCIIYMSDKFNILHT